MSRVTTKLAGKSLARFRRRLLAWYRSQRQDFPWRRERDAYRIWVAEVMLQQTRIVAALPYYEKFIARFSTVESLAAAPQEEVLRYWAGLGYYSRARNLHRAAREIVAHHGGNFPRSWEKALALPGVGRYTAAAVLSIAYDAPRATLDGNVARVLARVAARGGDLRAQGHWKRLETEAQRLVAKSTPGEWNQALMELGERICTPQAPRCKECPVAQWCRARRLGMTNKIPRPRRKRLALEMRVAAAVIVDPQGRALLTKSPGAHEGVLFSRMWQFPATGVTRDAKCELARHIGERFGISLALKRLEKARHSVTYRKITLLPFLAHVRRLPNVPDGRKIRLADVGGIAVSSATRKIAAAAQKTLIATKTMRA